VITLSVATSWKKTKRSVSSLRRDVPAVGPIPVRTSFQHSVVAHRRKRLNACYCTNAREHFATPKFVTGTPITPGGDRTETNRSDESDRTLTKSRQYFTRVRSESMSGNDSKRTSRVSDNSMLIISIRSRIHYVRYPVYRIVRTYFELVFFL